MKPALISVRVKSIAVFALALALLAIPALAANPAQDTATRNFQKTLTLGANQTLAMENKFGEVHIHGENSREVKISATIRVQATTQTEAEHNADQIKIEVSQDAEGIKVRTAYPDQHSWYIRVGKGPSYSVDYDIAVPSDAKLWLRNNFGNVEVRSVRGWADVENGHGKLELRDSGAAKLTNSFGQVDVNGADGNLTVVNNNGAVTVSTVKGTVDVKDRFAAITVSNVQGAVSVSGGNGAVEISDAGAATVSNSFGSVNARNIHGDLKVSNHNGSIDANTVSGNTTANTSFGPVTLGDMGGSIAVDNQNGSVVLSAARQSSTCKNITVKTSFSPIQVRLPESAGYNLSARTSFGRINSELPITTSGPLGGDSMNGKIGNGGCTLSLTNSNGNIDILKLSK
jgi:DUF4097 and DUF4098 domain-containing protein YvlB